MLKLKLYATKGEPTPMTTLFLGPKEIAVATGIVFVEHSKMEEANRTVLLAHSMAGGGVETET